MRNYYEVDAIVSRLEDKSFSAKIVFNEKEYTVNHNPNGLNSSIMAEDFIKLFSKIIPDFEYKIKNDYHISSLFTGKKSLLSVAKVTYIPSKNIYKVFFRVGITETSFILESDKNGTDIEERARKELNRIKPKQPHKFL